MMSPDILGTVEDESEVIDNLPNLSLEPGVIELQWRGNH